MRKSKILQQMFGAATLAMLCGAGTVHAQADKNAAGMSKENQAGKMSATGQNETTSVTATPTAKMAASAAGGASSGGSMRMADQKMMSDIARSNAAEIAAGKLAQSKSQNDQVKAFAQKMIDDHTKAQQELQQIAQAKGVTLPNEPDAAHKAMGKKLSSLSGDAFDRRYMQQGGLADHKATHQLLQKVQTQARDPELKAFAAKIMPTVDEHLSLAQQSQGTKAGARSSGLSGSSGTMGSGASGASTSGSTGNSSNSGAGSGAAAGASK